MYVTKTDVVAGSGTAAAPIDPKGFASLGVHMTTCGVAASDPTAIYIRPFCIDNATFTGYLADSAGEMPLRKALTPLHFAGSLKEQLSKIAPARILKDNEIAPTGWLVEGEFQVVDGGDPVARFFAGHLGAGRSFMSMHVRITDVNTGVVIYEFDVAGGSRLQGPAGTIRASGLGIAAPFDLENAAERIYLALTPNVHRYGKRSSVALR